MTLDRALPDRAAGSSAKPAHISSVPFSGFGRDASCSQLWFTSEKICKVARRVWLLGTASARHRPLRHCTARWQPPKVAAAPQHSCGFSKFPFKTSCQCTLPRTILPGWSERAAQRTADRSAPAAGTAAAAPAPPAWRGSLPRGYRATAGWLRCLRRERRMIKRKGGGGGAY